MEINLKYTIEDSHREFTQRQLKAIIEGEDLNFTEVCPCTRCVNTRELESKRTIWDKIWEFSDKLTYGSLPREAKYFVTDKTPKVYTYADNFKEGMFG